jgi:hypothetical protein
MDLVNHRVSFPSSWLLRVGWKRAGLFDVDDAPARGRGP